MADFGLRKAVWQGVKRAKVARPGLDDVLKEATPAAPKVAPPVIDSPLPALETGPAILDVAAPDVARPTAKVAPPASPPPVAPKVPDVPPADLGEEAGRLSRIKLGDYDLGPSYQTNFDTITTTDDVKAVIADTAARNAGRIEEARRGVITNEQLKALAADLDVQEDVVRQVMERETGGVLNAEVILAARQVLNSSADRVLSLAKRISSGQANDLERVQFRRQIQFHDEYQRQFMGARAETGRALNAFGIPTGLDQNPAQLAKLKQIVENMHGRDTDQLASMLSQIDTLEGVNNFVKKYNRSKIAGTLQELFINSILSGPTTHIVNAASNALFLGMNSIETAVAAQLGRVLPGEAHVQIGEASALVYGQLSGFRDAMRYAAKAFRMGDQLDGSLKYEGHTRRAISSQNYFPDGVPNASLGAAIDFLGAAIRLPTERVMAPTDEFFRTLAYRGELARQAYRSVMEEAAGRSMTSDEVAQRIAEFMSSPPPGAVSAAQNFTDYATFQTPLTGAAADFQRFANRAHLFPIAPFIRTPINVFMAGLVERSPLAVFSSRFREAIRKGGPERDLALARVSVGTLTVGSVALAVQSGAITGGGPQNPDARRLLEQTGWQPYSFVWTDEKGRKRYQSYARAEPLAYVVGATADAAELMAYLDDEELSEPEGMNEAIAAIVAGVANNTMSKTFLQGVADFTEALSDPGRYAKSWADRMALAFLPYSSFRRAISKVDDPLVRQGWEFSDRMRNVSGVPGWSATSPPKRDVFGEPVRYRGGPLLGVLSPFPMTRERRDPLLNDLVGVMEATGDVPLSLPGRRIDGMKLTVEEYDELIRYSRTEPLVNDNTFREALMDLMDSDLYLDATADMRLTLVREVQRRYDRAARVMLEEENPAFAERLALHRSKRALRLYGEATE